MINIIVLSGIQTWDLSVCLYLKLKHGDLDHSATMASFSVIIYLNNFFAGRRLEKLNCLLNKPWFCFEVGVPLVNLLGLFAIVSHAITISDKFAQEKVIIKVS